MAGDTHCAYEPPFQTPKVFRAGDFLLGVAGSLANGLKIVHWMQSGCDEKHPPQIRNADDDDSDFDVLIMSRQGLWLMDQDLIPIKIIDRQYAIGKGASVALSAMLNNRTPLEAVQMAAVVCPDTRGPFDVQYLVPKHAKTKR